MPGVFISYRRADAQGYSGRLYDHLSGHFGEHQVFRDIDRIEPGRDFVETIEQSVASCDALLVLIGSQFLTIADEKGRRLDDPDDFLRLEVARALKRNVPVIPVLIPGADKMPDADELPEDLEALPRRQAIKVSDETWSHDIDRLIASIEKIGVVPVKKASKLESVESAPRRVAGAKKVWAAVAFAAALAALGGLGASSGPTTPPGAAVPVAAAQAPSAQLSLPDTELAAPVDEIDENVLEAQSLLTALQYAPGPADGKLGAQTKRAVRQFQEDQGLRATGQVTARLLAQLEEALSEGEMASPSDAHTDLSGDWYDSTGILYKLRQRGRNVNGEAYDPTSGYTEVLGRLRGEARDGVLTYAYQTILGTAGSGQATLESDGEHMVVVSTDSMTGVSTDRLHRGHLPQ